MTHVHVSLLFAQPHHPLVVAPEAGVADAAALQSWIGDHADELRAWLPRHGAVLFRGFGLEGAADFQATVTCLGGESFGYVGGNSPRTRVLQDVFTATDYPATEVISLHNELSYMPSWPGRLFFFSELPALTGGQTSLANGADILRAMPADIVAQLRERKVSYVRRFHPRLKMGKTWQATYGTEDREQLSEILAEHGSTAAWDADGGLRVSTRTEPFAIHAATGAEVWFNQAEQWHPSALNPPLRQMLEPRGQLAHHCEFGDGGPMDDAMLAAIRRVLVGQKLLFDWRRGDLLMVDNVLMLHGRESFTGSRKTFAYLSRA